MKKNLLAITGVFMPYNGTITQITYKHLCNLDYNIDVVTFKGKKDLSMEKILSKDKKYKKFNFHYLDEDWQKVYINKSNLNIIKVFKNLISYYRKCISMIKTKNYDILYSNSMPNYTHYAAYLVKKRLGNKIKWYASFTDPIADNPYVEEEKNNKLLSKGRILYWIQKHIYYKKKYQTLPLKYADKLIFISEELRDFVIKGDEELLKKSVIIPLTYIEEWPMYKELINYTPKFNKKDKIKFMHFGNIYGLRKIDSFLQALLELSNEVPDLKERVEFHQYGDIASKQLKTIKEYGLNDLFKVNPKINYTDCVSLMKDEADVLIIFDTILEENKIQPFLPSKVLDYLLIKKPIFSITTKNSPIYSLIGDDHMCVMYDVDQIKKGILAQMDDIKIKTNNYLKYENKEVIKSTLGNDLDLD